MGLNQGLHSGNLELGHGLARVYLLRTFLTLAQLQCSNDFEAGADTPLDRYRKQEGTSLREQ
jgi:hypothetical protein